MTSALIQTTFIVQGLDCSSEETLIRNQLKNLERIERLSFNFITEEVIIEHQNIDLNVLKTQFELLGMTAHLKDKTINNNPSKSYSWLNLGIAFTLSIIAETLFYVYAPQKPFLAIFFSIGAILLAGKTCFKKGWLALKTKTLNINSLMLIAIMGALCIGEWPEAAMVTVLFSLAEHIEQMALDRARHAIQNLMELAPAVASVKDNNNQIITCPVHEILPDSIIIIKPGERIPLDGVIVKGHSSINQSSITGESLPISKKIGDLVYAGTLNEKGAFEMKVTSTSDQTLLAKITQTIESAQAEKAPTQRFIDRFSMYYTPTMVFIAFLVAILPPILMHSSWINSIYKALTVLIIACPCALVISTPVSIVSALTAAAKHGLLIKGGQYIENGYLLKMIAFDKTGTLTEGKPVITDCIILNPEMTQDQIYQIAASLEIHSEHPIAHAFTEKYHSSSLLDVELFKAVTGQGVKGYIDDKLFYLGNHGFAEQLKVCSQDIENTLQQLESQGKTTVILISENRVLAIFAIADTARPSAKEAISQLKSLGIQTVMLTGDSLTTAQEIGQSLHVDAIEGNLLPQEKLDFIVRHLKQNLYVGMVGDGINDTPALARASISFAMGKGTDTALEIADITLMTNNLLLIPYFLKLSKKTAAVLLQNITLSLTIKVLFFFMALSGVASLWMAVFADVGASLIVIANSIRLLYFKD
jgi:Cd2+/Zn2+-exporting ATPase